VLIVLFFVFVANWIINGIPKDKMRKSFVFSFLFLVIASSGYIIANDRQMFSYAILRLSEAIFLLFVLSKTRFNFFKIATSFVISILIHASIGIYQFFSQNIVANKYLGIAGQISSNYGVSVLKNSTGRFLRAYGGMPHPNMLGGFIVVAILFLFIVFVKKYSKTNSLIKIALCLSLHILNTGLILTFSRSAYLALFISILPIFFYFIYKKQFYTIKLFVIIFCLSFFVNFVVFNDLIIARMFSSDISSDVSGIERLELNKQAIFIIKNNLLLGVGLGNYVPHAFLSNIEQLDIWQYQPVHNIFLLILSEMGIFGLLMFLFILIFCFIENMTNKNIYSFFVINIIIAILVISCLDHYFITSFSGLVLLFFIFAINTKKDLHFLC
jgi:O-antigen ligase